MISILIPSSFREFFLCVLCHLFFFVELFLHLVAGIELKISRFYLPCYVCVCPKTRQAHCATVTHLTSFLAFTQGVCPKTRQMHCFRCSVRVFAFTQCVCPKLRQVTVLSLLCSTKVLVFSLTWIRYFTLDLFPDYFSLSTAQCICPKTWQVRCLLN